MQHMKEIVEQQVHFVSDITGPNRLISNQGSLEERDSIA
jgi:hypothetical protein